MAQQTNDTLKGFFENNDTITATTFGDLIDSYLSLVETSAQTVTSPVTISAVSFIQASGTRVQAQETDVSALIVTGAFSADANSLNFSTVSASSLNVKTTISGSAAYFNSIVIGGVEQSALGKAYAWRLGGQTTVNQSAGGISKVQSTNVTSSVAHNKAGILSALPQSISNSANSPGIQFKYLGAGNTLFHCEIRGGASKAVGSDDPSAGLFDMYSAYLAKNSAAKPAGEKYRVFSNSQAKIQCNLSAANPVPLYGTCVISAETSAIYLIVMSGHDAGNKQYTFSKQGLTMREI